MQKLKKKRILKCHTSLSTYRYLDYPTSLRHNSVNLTLLYRLKISYTITPKVLSQQTFGLG